MDEMLIAGTPVTLGDLVLLVEHQQDQISDLEEQLADLARQVTAARSGAGRVG
jgi:CheY-like chemotaxis protein